MNKLLVCALAGAMITVSCCNFRKRVTSGISCEQNNDTWVPVWDSTLSNHKELKTAFDVLIKHFQDDKKRELDFFRKIEEVVDSSDYIIKLPVLWESYWTKDRDKMIKVEISDHPIVLNTKEIVLENPYGNGYPVSYSVIYQDRFISLFESGQFVCHSIPSMQRDLSFEEKINTKNFDYHWVIGNKLVGISQERYYYLDSDNRWIKYRESIPLKNQPKLFEDASYISFCDCEGEFGGTVYFYNKATRKITFTEATCAYTIYMKEGKYYVLTELLHMTGRSTLEEISNPDQLTPIDLETIRKHPRGREVRAIGYSDKSNASRNVFTFSEIGFLSTFDYKGRTIYLTHLPRLNRTFLAEVENNTVKIINPLFNSRFYYNEKVTTLYPNTIFINGTHYQTARYREVSCIIIKGDEFLKIDWNKKYP